MDALMTAIVTWLSVNFGMPAIYDHPNIVLMPQAEVTMLRYGTNQLQDGRAVIAVYNDARHSVAMVDTWNGRTAAELSVLVHEMVHHLQNRAALTYPCPAARERLAYAAQEKWLGQFGSNLEKEFGIDPMTLKLVTSCDFR